MNRQKRIQTALIIQIAVIGLLSAETLCAQNAGRISGCNVPAKDPITYISLPGHPFSTIATSDGCWLFVSVSRLRVIDLKRLSFDRPTKPPAQ